MLEDFDKNVSILAESLARKLNRRKMVSTTVKGVFTAIAAATIGQVINVRQAFAATCTCDDNWTLGQPCDNIGFPCPHPTAGCPKNNCVACGNGDCNNWCKYPTNGWVSCTGLGNCHNGYRVCVDCKCKNKNGQYDCNYKCTCLSDCICCGCCTPDDIRAEMQRLAALSA